jgi:hypothetical protein
LILIISLWSWRAVCAIEQARHLTFQISDEESDVDSIEGAVAIDIACSIEGVRCERARRIAIRRRIGSCALKIIYTIDIIDAIGGTVAIDVAGDVEAVRAAVVEQD